MINLRTYSLSHEDYLKWIHNGVISPRGEVISLDKAIEENEDIFLPDIENCLDQEDYDTQCFLALKPLPERGYYPSNEEFYVVNELESDINFITHQETDGSYFIVIGSIE